MVSDDKIELSYLIIGSFSILGSLIIFFTFFIGKDVRKKYVNQFVFIIALCDMMFTSKFMIVGIIGGKTALGNPIICYVSATIGQFFGVSSILWNMFMSIHLIMTIRNPFATYSRSAKFYHLIAWGYSLIVTLMMIIEGQIGDSGDGTCWIPGGQNLYRMTFFIPLLLALLVAIISLFFSILNFSSNSLLESAKFRKTHLIRLCFYVLCFAVFWCGPVIFRIIQLMHKESYIIQYFSAVGVAGQALVNGCIWLSNPAVHKLFGRKKKKKEKLLSDYDLESDFDKGLLSEYNNSLDTLLRYELMKNILEGICESVLNSSTDYTPRITPDHFKATEKRLVNNNKNGKFLFAEMAPKVFSRMREVQGLPTKSYLQSLDPQQLRQTFSDSKFSDGRSGSFFWISNDNRLIIKSVARHEHKCLTEILQRYYSYMTSSPSNLITKFYGMYTIQMPNIKKIRFVTMENIFNTPYPIHLKYDIKGSWIDRSTEKSKSVKKDSDLSGTLSLPYNISQFLVQQLQRDAMFLKSVEVMDYSLLIGVCDKSKLAKMPLVNSKVFGGRDKEKGYASLGNEIFFFGLIDILQKYNSTKRIERFAKVYVLRKNKEGVSVTDCEKYAKRFIKKVHEIFGVTNINERKNVT